MMAIGESANSNVSTIAEIEREAILERTWAERVGDNVARGAGRPWFIAVHIILFSGWILLNTLEPGKRAFDPYPFQFLTFATSLEAIFLSLFVLMSQNRAGRQADQRSHLDLQINLLAEQENTKMLQMLQELCDYHRLAAAKDPEVETLATPVKPETLVKELKEKLPADG